MRIEDLPPLETRRDDELLPLATVACYFGMRTATLRKGLSPTRGRSPRGLQFVRMGDGPKAPIYVYAGVAKAWLRERTCTPTPVT